MIINIIIILLMFCYMVDFQWEVVFISTIQEAASPVLTRFMEIVSMCGEETLMILVVGLIYWCLDKRLGRTMALGMVFSLLAGEMVKGVVMRRRPYFDHSEVVCLRAPSGKGDVMDVAIQGFSFPSLHASNSIVMFGTLATATRRKWMRAVFLVMPLLIGFSRPFLGVHYPTDVIAGWLLGCVALFAALKITSLTDNYLKICLVVALLALPGWFFCHTEVFYTIYGLMLGMLLGFAFECRFVHFSNTKNVLRCVVRLIGGMALFFCLSIALKSVLPPDRVCRCIRYCFTSFVSMGVYPLLFKYMDRLWKSERSH